MDQINPAGLSSVSTVDPLHKCTLGAADAAAAKTTKLQKQGRPWTCSKRKVRVTNAQCLAAYLAGEDRRCVGCSIPNILPKTKESEVPSVKKGICESCGDENVLVYLTNGKRLCHACRALQTLPKAQPADELPEPKQPAETARPVEIPPSWDDFTPHTSSKTRPNSCHASIRTGKIDLSVAVLELSGLAVGDRLELAYRQGTSEIAIRKAPPESPDQNTAKLCGKPGSSRYISCRALIERLGVENRKRLPVEFYPWGIVIKAGTEPTA